MNDCLICRDFVDDPFGLIFLNDLGNGHFAALWDPNPVTPGHALVVPKRHVQHMRDLTTEERHALIDAVMATKSYLINTNLTRACQGLADRFVRTKSEAYVQQALAKLETYHGAPDGFNDGLNDGVAAGQTILHFHYHVMPRWKGDSDDPRGGIRHMFDGMGEYYNGLKQETNDDA